MRKIIIVILLTCVGWCQAQQNIKAIEQKFNELAKEQPGLDESIISEVTG